jgi:hypothetical protein
MAQLPVPASSQFDLTGFLQEATLDTPADAHSGGKLKVNGHVVIVPRETIVIFPANALTWQELFAQAPLPWGIAGTALNGAGGTLVAGPTSGMAAADCATNTSPCTAPPLTTWEVHVVGNRVLGGPAGADVYIAGLIDVSQQGLNTGAGFINFIDYAKGEMRVGGVIGDATTGARVRINDPVGRYTSPPALNSTDLRFTVDPDNPTIIAATGYPMCLPRGSQAGDAQCPQGNRPIAAVDPVTGITTYVTQITTNNVSNPAFPIVPGFPDSHFQAPMEVGDYLIFAGTLVKDAPAGGFAAGDGPTVGPMPALGTAATYISAHTITNNVGIWTWPGSDPAYVMTEVTLIGTGGLTVLGAGEAVVRTRFEGMTTDVDPNAAAQRGIHLYGMDLNPASGAVTDRDWGTIGVDPGPPNGAVKGRWRFRPPCAVFGTVPAKPDKQCVMNASGTFLPPTREMRAVIEGSWRTGQATTAANGLIYGQYHAPILEYIFPENVPGTPIPENNFNTIDFLAKGGYTSAAGTLVGVLNPWPSNVLPTAACTAPVASAGGPYSVASGGTVALAGSSSGTTPITFAWTATAGTFSNAAVATPIFTAPAGPATVTLTLTATNACGSNAASTTVAVATAGPPTVNAIASLTVNSGTPVTLNITGTDPAGTALTFTVAQTAGPAPNVAALVVTQNTPAHNPANAARATFTHALGVGAPAVTLTFSITARNVAGTTSVPVSVSVTVIPLADVVSITTAQYRTSKQRLDFTATSSVISPNVVLTLQPYVTTDGTTFDPASLGNVLTNAGAGTYTLTLVGAPRPACNPPNGAFATPCAARPLVIKSNLGGTSGPTALTNIRQ